MEESFATFGPASSFYWMTNKVRATYPILLNYQSTCTHIYTRKHSDSGLWDWFASLGLSGTNGEGEGGDMICNYLWESSECVCVWGSNDMTHDVPICDTCIIIIITKG